MKYFANAARDWRSEFFKGISSANKDEARLKGSTMTIKGLDAKGVFELAKNAFPCIQTVNFVLGCYQTQSVYSLPNREITINGQWASSNVGSVVITLHEAGHALQHSIYGGKVFDMLYNDVEGKIAVEADAWRHAFHLITKLNVLNEAEIDSAKVLAKYLLSTYVKAAGEKLPHCLTWLE